MSSPLTIEQVLSSAPDASSAAAGRKLANPRNWEQLGQSAQSLWGLCRGSAKEPYQVAVDLSGPAFRCSCPSRKFPCKHAIGLMLILADQPAAVPLSEPPAWMGEWLLSRARSAERREQRAQEVTPPDAPPAAPQREVRPAASRSRSAREQKVSAGLEELDRWMHDQIRSGIAALQAQSPAVFDTMAARMVDAQAPGVARWLRLAASDCASGEGWQRRLLDRMARLHLLNRAYRRLDALEPAVRADVETAIGFTVRQEEVLAGEGVVDHWTVIGRRVENEDKLRVQRTWLWAERLGQPALVLDFAAGAAVLDRSLTPGLRFEAEAVFYPSATPLRLLLRERRGLLDAAGSLPAMTIMQATSIYAEALGRNPWLERCLLLIGPVLPLLHADRWHVQDTEGRLLPFTPLFSAGWRLLALSGGRPITIVGEWDGTYLIPLSAQVDDRMLTFGAG